MKFKVLTHPLFFSIILAGLTLFTACDSGTDGGEAAAEGTETSATTDAGEALSLKLNLAPGAKFTQVMDMDMKVTTSAMGQTMNMDMNMGTTTAYEVKEAGEQTVMDATFTRFTTNMAMMGMNIDYDSEVGADESNPMTSSLGKVMDAMVGETLSNTYAADASLLKTEGMENIMQKMLDAVDGNQNLVDQYSQNANQSSSHYAAVLPAEPVKVGDTWTSDVTFNSNGIDMIAKNTYVLKGRENGMAMVDVNTDLTLDKKALEGMEDADVTMTGTQKGTLTVNETTGWTEAIDLTQNIDMEVTTMGMSMPTSIASKITVTTE